MPFERPDEGLETLRGRVSIIFCKWHFRVSKKEVKRDLEELLDSVSIPLSMPVRVFCHCSVTEGRVSLPLKDYFYNRIPFHNKIQMC